VAPELFGLGLLSVVDRSGLEAYCIAYSQWRAIEQKLRRAEKRRGADRDEIRDMVIDSVRLADRMRKFMVEFGFTPVSRMRLARDPKSEDDDFDKFVNAKREMDQPNAKAPSRGIH